MSNWTCPYCDRDQVLGENFSVQTLTIAQDSSNLGKLAAIATSITCANQKCQQLYFRFALYDHGGYGDPPRQRLQVGDLRHEWQLLPASQAKPQPDYIPKVILNDYVEACSIRDLSPKASATLSRRCLQGMIRDFAGIAKGRLVDEIEELRKRVDAGSGPSGVHADSVEAIDHVRGVGNIGAHMQKDINLIVDIDPDEAQMLIDLIELLFREWYVTRHDRQQRLAAVKAMAQQKHADQKQKPPASTNDPAE
jgi:hypothetical protein